MKNKNAAVLIATDDIKTREMAKIALESEGLAGIFCGDGEETLESAKVAAGRLRLLVLEMFLSKADGFEVIAELAKEKVTKLLPSLMLLNIERSSSLSSDEKIQKPGKNVSLGADDYLQKPFDAEELRGQIHSMTKHHRNHAQPHPVSGLPGHPELEKEVARRLASGQEFTFLCMDINHFRPFNDHYGADKGNQAIRLVAKLIQSQKKGDSFPAHVDGDDFIVLLPPSRLEETRKVLRQGAGEQIQKLYSAQDRKKGFFRGKGRDKRERVFPLMTLALADFVIKPGEFLHYGRIVAQMNERLRQAKIGSQEVL